MKGLIFRELLLQSHWDRKARRIIFHPEVTIVKGKNQAGKSALLTSAYRCFGAEPAQNDSAWNDAQVYSFLTFELGGQRYRLFHYRSIDALFERNYSLQHVFH